MAEEELVVRGPKRVLAIVMNGLSAEIDLEERLANFLYAASLKATDDTEFAVEFPNDFEGKQLLDLLRKKVAEIPLQIQRDCDLLLSSIQQAQQ